MRAQFGEFTLDTQSRQLRRGASEVHLSPKAFELLCALVNNRPRALSKAELHERLWPSTFVSDATMTSVVAELRTALGEKARSARYVRTVHRFGYAFKADVTEIRSQPPEAGTRVRCWIVWQSGQSALNNGDHLLGRDSDVSVWLECPTVSRHHARIHVEGAAATLEDLGSKNGTFLRGERVIAPAALVDGDKIQLGSTSVTFRVMGESGSTVTERTTSRT